MTVAETLAEVLVSTRFQDLPECTIDHAAMIVASTLASATGSCTPSNGRGSAHLFAR